MIKFAVFILAFVSSVTAAVAAVDVQAPGVRVQVGNPAPPPPPHRIKVIERERVVVKERDRHKHHKKHKPHQKPYRKKEVYYY